MDVTPRAFKAISNVNIDEINELTEKELRSLLPSLVRIALCSCLDNSDYWQYKRKKILKLLSETEVSNTIVSLLSIDFHSLENEVKKEQSLRSKIGFHPNDSFLISSNTDRIALEFEKSDGNKRIRIILSELFAAQTFAKNYSHQSKNSSGVFKMSELFDNEVYLDNICDVLCIAISELPNSLLLTDTIETLLYVKNGTLLIQRLMINFPESFHEVCMFLLMSADKQEEESIFGKRRIEVIRNLCKINPSYALVIRNEAMESCRMPGLCILLTLDSIKNSQSGDHCEKIREINDFVSFVSGIFFGNDEKIRNWFVQYIRNCQKKTEQGFHTNLAFLREELLKNVEFILERNEGNKLCNYLVEVCSILRLYCALRGIASMRFGEEESSAILKLVTRHPSSTPAGLRVASIGLCLLLACPSLLSSQEAEKKTIDWIQWLVREESLFGQVAGVRSSLGEILLLIAIHFHSNQINAISELVTSTLGIKLALRLSSLSRMKTIFIQEVFTDQMITTHAVKVAVTSNLNNNIVGFLPVHCIYQLLKSRAFTKYKVPIKDWIFKQLCNCVAPINPILPPLIDAYVNSVIVPYSKTSQATTNEPISEEELLSVFKHKIYSVEEEENSKMELDETTPACILTTQLLFLYYILLYEDVRLSQMKSIVFNNRLVKKYSPSLFSQLPIFHLMQEAKNEPANYGVLFPRLLPLISTHYPHLCLVHKWFAAEKKVSMRPFEGTISLSTEKKKLSKAFDLIKTNSDFTIRTFDHLLTFPNKYLWPLASSFVDKLPLLLDSHISSTVLEKAKKIWWRLNCIFPDALSVMTINALKYNQFDAKKLTWNDTVLDPLNVLRCDERVFRCPALMEINLHILQGFLIASRTYFSHYLLEKPSKTAEEEKDREELRIALITAQESSAIQILLECCLPSQNLEDSQNNERLNQVQQLIGIHLHQIFIADPNLAKLVHFQGYPNQLLPLTVSSIPSMHICLEFIPELLSQPDLEKQIFAIELCSYLCKQYPILKSLCVAKLCFNVSHTLLNILESDKREKFFIAVIPALIRMCKPFPPLREDGINLILRLSQICLSRLSNVDPNFILTKMILQKSVTFEDVDWGEAKKFIYSLPTKNSLCQVIQTSFTELFSLINSDTSTEENKV